MPTPIQITNQALRGLAANSITAFTDATAEGRIANAIYNETVISVLRAYPWNSEIRRVRLIEEEEQLVSVVRFAGDGLDDLTAGGAVVSGTELVFRIVIDATGAPDTFKWKADDDDTYTTGVAITGAAQTLSEGVTITFAATTGHTLNDEWHVDTNLPEWGFDHRYRLPNEMLYGTSIDEVLRNFRVENGFLLTNVGSPISLKYVAQRGVLATVGLFTTDVPYEENLISTIIARLEAEMAYPLTKNDSLVQTKWALYREKLAEARAVSRREGAIEVVQDTQFEDLRRGAGVVEDQIDVGKVWTIR